MGALNTSFKRKIFQISEWGLKKFEYVVFCSFSLHLKYNFRNKGNLMHEETQNFTFTRFDFFKNYFRNRKSASIKKGWKFHTKKQTNIFHFKLFVPLVKVINSMPEQNLHRLNFRKILKL